MIALVVRQPWASMIAAGVKRLEIRSRRTNHRGPLLIVAGRRDADGRLLPAAGPLTGEGLPAGVAVCIVDVLGCRPMTAADEPAACVPQRPGHWAWVLGNARACEAVAVRGMPGLFDAEIPADVTPPPRG